MFNNSGLGVTNTFLRASDYDLVSYACLRQEFERIYLKDLGKRPSLYGAKSEDQTKIHWSRDWEYPWAVIHSGVKAGHRVLDCGCGGSPLLPFLARYGCETYGVDPGVGKPRPSLVTHYRALLGKLVRKGSISLKRLANRGRERSRSDSPKIVSRVRRALQPVNDAWYHDAGRIKRLGLDIQYFADSMESLHFESEYFDRVYSISVVEHLPEQVAYAGMKEMARVLKKGGLLVVTIDNDGPHVTPELRGKFQELIACTGLSLAGETEFSMPDASDVPGTYNVVGFVLAK